MKFLIKVAVIATTLLLGGLSAQSAVAQAVEQGIGQGTSQGSEQLLPPLPIEFNPGRSLNPGRPRGRRRGGGSRGSCQAALPLTAIAYADSRMVEELGVPRTDEIVGGLTVQPNPILWFYLPAPVQEMGAELVVTDSQEQVAFLGTLNGETERDGIVGLKIPAPLETGETYQWFLTVDCDETERMTVNGWVERTVVGLDATRTLAQATARNRVALSASYGFLQDAVSEMVQLRYFELDDELVQQDWEQMLATLELSDLSDVPVLPCCTLASAVDGPDSGVPVPEAAPEEEVMPEVVPEAIPEEVPEEEERDTRSILQRARDRGN
ncbi:MAG: DUF928 domain-containing protein [Cyanobacteria bacterium J06598_1]